MAERKPLFIADEGHHEEMAPTDTATLGGLTLNGNLNMGTNRITNMGDAINLQDAVTLQQLNAVAAGFNWHDPVKVLNMINDANMGGASPVGPIIGDAYVVNNWGGGYNNGDIVEWNGSSWVIVVPNSGGEPPNNTYVLVSATSPTTPSGSFSGNNLNFALYNSTTNLWSFTLTADGDASVINGGNSVYYNSAYTFNTGVWTLFLAVPEILAGDGLDKVINTLSVKAGDGVKIDSDYVAVDLSPVDPGLELVGTAPDKTLQAKVDGAHGIIRGASGLELEIDNTPDTLDVDADGLKVVGLPSLFKVNGSPVGPGVTSANLNTLTNGSDASALHYHTGLSGVQEVPFTNASILVINHQRHHIPLVQVVIGNPAGWDLGGWSNVVWNEDTSGYVRLPDDQYVTTHESDDIFWVEFSGPLTGRVLYF
jgi:hypothetical protein